MGLFTPTKRVKHRRFSYEPRFYDPEKEKKIKERLRIRSRARRRKTPYGLIYSIILLSLAVYIYMSLT